MKEKLAQVKSTIDKREGSLIHFACGANSAEAAQMYITLEWMFRQMFGDTADREYLAKIAYDTRGLIPEAATHAVLKGKFNIEVKSGIRFSLEDLNYYVSDFIEFLRLSLAHKDYYISFCILSQHFYYNFLYFFQ